MVDIEEVVEVGLELGMSEEESRREVEDILKKAAIKGIKSEKVLGMILRDRKSKLERMRRLNAKMLDAVILGWSDYRDWNDRWYQRAMRMYEENPEEAVKLGKVKIVDGQPVPVDKWGNEIVPFFARKIWMLYEGSLYTGYWEREEAPARLGEYSFFGRVNQANKTIRILWNEVDPKLVSVVQDKDVFDTVLEAVDRILVPFENLEEAASTWSDVYAVQGYISGVSVSDTSNVVYLVDETGDMRLTSFWEEPYMVNGLKENTEILALGSLSISSRGTPVMNGYGWVLNPESEFLAELI